MPQPALFMMVQLRWMFALGAALAMGCAPDTGGSGDVGNANDSLSTEMTSSAKQLLLGVPPPQQIVFLLKDAGTGFDAKLLNPESKSADYQTTDKAALNLGVYSANLAYCQTFGQTGYAIKYFSAARLLAEQLGISGSFALETARRIDRARDNPDSLSRIAAEAFADVSEQLAAAGNLDAFRLIALGGFVETLHLASELYALKPTPALAQVIATQKPALGVLGELLDSATDPSPALTKAKAMLKPIQQAYEGVTLDYTYTDAVTDSVTKRTSVRNESKAAFTPATLELIRKAATDARTQIVE